MSRLQRQSPPEHKQQPSQPQVSTQIPAEALEPIRNRLSQVHQSLRKLADQINLHNRNPAKVKLPSYSNLQSQFQVLITQLQTIAARLDTNDEILKSTNVYPVPSFPTTQHEGLVTTLLRKKPLPEVDEWIDAAIAESESFKLPIHADDEFAEWCYAKVKELEDEFTFEGFHTEEELQLMETEEGPKNEEEKTAAETENKKTIDEISVGKKPMSPNTVLRFMTRGVL
ncbi:hypothetical protein CJJ07_002593 [Candidozyma auris]|nr:hypothetical protein CJJ07_002593 [[Candida] auris]QEL58353.1 hypothetical protein CJJ09_000389 [[Candida] auris]